MNAGLQSIELTGKYEKGRRLGLLQGYIEKIVSNTHEGTGKPQSELPTFQSKIWHCHKIDHYHFIFFSRSTYIVSNHCVISLSSSL